MTARASTRASPFPAPILDRPTTSAERQSSPRARPRMPPRVAARAGAVVGRASRAVALARSRVDVATGRARRREPPPPILLAHPSRPRGDERRVRGNGL